MYPPTFLKYHAFNELLLKRWEREREKDFYVFYYMLTIFLLFGIGVLILRLYVFLTITDVFRYVFANLMLQELVLCILMLQGVKRLASTRIGISNENFLNFRFL